MLTGDPTENDYLNLIRLRISDHVTDFQRKVAEIDGRAERMGAMLGSNYLLMLTDELQRAFRPAAADVLRALPIVSRPGGLDRATLIDLTGPRLTEMLETMIAITRIEHLITSVRIPEFQNSIRSRIDECRGVIAVLIRQTLIGYDKVWDEEGRTVTNTIHAENITGPIQQGTSHSTQNSSITVDRGGIANAVRAVDESLGDPANDPATVTSLRSDIATINAQLEKQSPSRGVLAEVGKSMRNIVEGVAGGMLTPAAMSAGMVLTSIL